MNVHGVGQVFQKPLLLIRKATCVLGDSKTQGSELPEGALGNSPREGTDSQRAQGGVGVVCVTGRDQVFWIRTVITLKMVNLFQWLLCNDTVLISS